MFLLCPSWYLLRGLVLISPRDNTSQQIWFNRLILCLSFLGVNNHHFFLYVLALSTVRVCFI